MCIIDLNQSVVKVILFRVCRLLPFIKGAPISAF